MKAEMDSTSPKVWVVASAFPPGPTIGAERPKKFVRHLTRCGFSTTVFTVMYGRGENINVFNGAQVRRSRRIFSSYFERKESHPTTLRSKIELLPPKILTALFDDSGWTWMPYLRRDLEHAWSEGNRPDIIIATGRPFLTFLTVSRFARKRGIPFVLDYRDAWACNPHPSYDNWFRRRLLRWLEGRVNRQAAGVVTVSRLTAMALNTDKEPMILYNLPDEGYVREIRSYTPDVDPISQDRLVLVYAGTLYPGRDMDPICAALAKLDGALRERIEIHYCGSSAGRAQAAFDRYGVQSQLISHGNLSKADATRLIAQGDVAVSIICSDSENKQDSSRGVITTKVFDYLILDKKVLNIVPEDFEFNTLADQVCLEGLRNHEPEDIDGIAEFLSIKLDAKDAAAEAGRGKSTTTMLAAWDAQMLSFNALLADVRRN